MPENIRSLARAHTDLALRTIVGLCSASPDESIRLRAAIELLDRGYGTSRPDLAGAEAITITIRKIFERDLQEQPLVIDHQANGNGRDG